MNKGFLKGIKDGLPICFGYLSVSFAFGIYAVGLGLLPLETVLISLTNLTSAGQLAAAPIIASGGLLSELALSQLIINLRYSLMSVSLSQKLDKSVRLFERFLIAFGITDEVFAVAASQKKSVTSRYMYGLILTPVLGWTGGTALGALAGNVLPSVITSALGLAIYGMFIAIVLPVAKTERAVLICVLLAAVLGCLFYYLPVLNTVPNGFVIIICSVIAAGVMATVRPVEVTDNE